MTVRKQGLQKVSCVIVNAVHLMVVIGNGRKEVLDGCDVRIESESSNMAAMSLNGDRFSRRTNVRQVTLTALIKKILLSVPRL